MFFYASKIFWFLVAPGNLLLILLVAGTLLLWIGRRRSGRGLITLAAVLWLGVAIVPAGTWMVVHLEERFPPPDRLPAAVDGIIVLGGLLDPAVSVARGQVALTAAAERLVELPGLIRRYPGTRLVFTGGSGDPFEQRFKEADMVRPVLEGMGLETSRLILENRSRNTWENAVFTRDLVRPEAGDRWLLVTSAFHMPRAVGCFRRAGWDVVPMPVDYGFRGPQDIAFGFSLINGLSNLDKGLHEWIGLLVYYLSGRTDAIFPGPKSSNFQEAEEET